MQLTQLRLPTPQIYTILPYPPLGNFTSFLRVFTDFGSFWRCKTTKRALGARSVGLFQRVTFRLLEVPIVAFAVFTVPQIVGFVGLRHRACIVIGLIEGFVATFVDQHQGIEFFFQ